MKKISLLAALIASLAPSILLHAQTTSNYAVPKDVRMSLPALPDLKVQWALPPGTADWPKKGIVFGVDPGGALCFSAGGRVLFYPSSKLVLPTQTPIEEFFWLGNGAQLVHSGRALGFLALTPAAKGPQRALLQFQPLASVPYAHWQMHPGSGNFFFVAGLDEKNKRTEISRWRSPDAPAGKSAKPEKPVRMLIATQTEVGAVTGTADTLFFSSGKAVFRVRDGSSDADVVFAHPTENIRELAFIPRAGLFYATDSSVGYIGDKQQFDFLFVHDPQIRVAGKDLYVLPGNMSNGVLKIAGLQDLVDSERSEGTSRRPHP